MKIKIEWDFDRDEWDVRDEKGDRLGHSSVYNGKYLSLEEVENVQTKLSKAIACIVDLDSLLYDDLESEAYKRVERFLEEQDE